MLILDAATDGFSRTLDRVVSTLTLIQHAVRGAFEALPRVGVSVGFWVLVLGVGYLVLRMLGPALRSRLWPQRRELLRVIPAGEASYDAAGWVGFYRCLMAIAPPAWKRPIVGVPWVTVELRHAEGVFTAICSCPTGVVPLLKASLHAALPGAELKRFDDLETQSVASSVARGRIGLVRDAIFPLGRPVNDPLRSISAALMGATTSVIQLSIEPDPGWERSAQRRFDKLSGFDHEGAAGGIVGFIAGIIVGALGELVGIFIPQSGAASMSAQPPSPRPPSYKHNLPPSDKVWAPAFRTEIRVCAWAQAGGQAKQVVHAIAGGFRNLDGANSARPRRVFWSAPFDRALASRAAPGRAAVHLSPEELGNLFHLPVADVQMEAAGIRLAPPRMRERAGSILCRADGPLGELMRIAQIDRRQHVGLTGPTGSGKTAMILSLALQDVEEGVGFAAVDPKGDLIRDLCERIPSRARDRVVLLDPSHRERPVALNVLECPDPAMREVACDAIVTIFRKTYQQFWGPRTEDVLRASLLTVMRQPDLTICEVPLLLLNKGFRAALTRDIDDRIGLKPFWDEYEELSPGQRLQMVGPLLNKLRAFLLRPTVRNILGQSHSTIDLAEVMDGGGILLVSLAKGLLGEDTSRLIGAFLVARIWQAALGRATRPPDQRRDFNLYLDEFQNYLYLPQSLDDVLAEARAYRLNLTLAHQHLGQLRDSTREAIDANVRTRVVFQSGQDDARYLSRQFAPLTEHQLQRLGRFQVAVRLCVDGHTEAPFTGTTDPPPASLGQVHADRLIRASLDRYGRPQADVEAEIVGRLGRFGIHGDFTEMAS